MDALSTIMPKVDASEVPLENLAANKLISDKDKTTEVSRQFEAVLLRQILQEAQKPVFKSAILTNSVGNDVYQDMITNQLADNISKSGTFGLAHSLEKQLTRQLSAAHELNSQDSTSDAPETAAKTATTHDLKNERKP